MADLLQILKGTGARPRITFYAAGVPSDLDSGVPVVTVTTPSGATSNPTASKVAATTGIYEFTLGAQAECTLLTVTWAGPIGGVTETLTTYVEVLGALLFNVADLRAFKVAGSTPFSSTATPLFTDQQIMDARTAVLAEFRAILGFHPVPRFCRETKDGGENSVILTDPGLKASKLLSVTVNGEAKSISGYTLRPSGILQMTSNYVLSGYFPNGSQNVTVEYVSGWPRVVGEGRDAAMVMAAKYLDRSGFSNAQTVTTPDGMSYTYEPSETGRGGFQRHTGVRDLDRWLNRHSAAAAMAI